MKKSIFPSIPNKKYFSIKEVSDLCNVKAHTLRYWEKEFKSLRPTTRRGNRRFYQEQDILIIRNIRSLLYEEGLTINGAKKRIGSSAPSTNSNSASIDNLLKDLEDILKDIKQAI